MWQRIVTYNPVMPLSPGNASVAIDVMLLPFRSRSACIALGVLPSNDSVLSNPSRRASRLALMVTVELNPDEIVLMVGFFAILIVP
jgi:hypothetical protein